MHKQSCAPVPVLASGLVWEDASTADERLLAVFLERLRRLLDQRAEHASALNPDGLRLLDRAIFSTYCDCRALGGQAIARGVIDSMKRAAVPAGAVGIGSMV